MEKEFTEWFEANEMRFAHAQFDEKEIAYSAWIEGQKLKEIDQQKEIKFKHFKNLNDDMIKFINKEKIKVISVCSAGINGEGHYLLYVLD